MMKLEIPDDILKASGVTEEDCFDLAECHPCCVPLTLDGEPFRPEDCDPLADWQTECGLTSPFGPLYPWVYDPSYENPDNTFDSFRELIGKDDEHQDFHIYLLARSVSQRVVGNVGVGTASGTWDLRYDTPSRRGRRSTTAASASSCVEPIDSTSSLPATRGPTL